jgi:hypothetical protein
MADPVSLALMAGGMGVKAIGAIFGGRAQKAAAKKAGTTLANTADIEQKRALEMPGILNPYIEERYGQAAQGVTDVTGRSADELQQTARQGYGDVMGQTREANAYLDPYSKAGSRSLATLSDLANAPQAQFDPSNLSMDPGYAFRMAEGQKAIERSAAARGIGQTGGTLKALTRYGQDAASQEYQNAFGRALSTFGANQSARQQQLGTLTGLVNTGYGASGQMGTNLTGAARFGADLTTNAAGQAGGWRNAAAQYGGNAQMRSTDMQAGNIKDYNDIARELRLGGAQATANSQLAVGQATADMWGGGAQAIGGGLSLAGMMGRGGGSTPGQYNNLPTVGASGGYNMPRRPYGW